MTDTTFADLSHWNGGPIDFAKYKAAGHDLIVLKAANDGHEDPKLHLRQREARAAGLKIGYYQYLTKNADAAEAARALMTIVGPLLPGEFLILDLEEGAGDQSARANLWNATIPGGELDYSGLAMFKSQLKGVPASQAKWIAAYRNREPSDVRPGTDVWQYTDHATFPGIPGTADGSIFHGTSDQLIARILGTGVAPTKKPYQHQKYPGSFHPGETNTRVGLGKILLTSAGYGPFLITGDTAAGRHYDNAMVKVVKAMQELHEQKVPAKDRWRTADPSWRPDGVLGARTWAWADQLAQLRAA